MKLKRKINVKLLGVVVISVITLTGCYNGRVELDINENKELNEKNPIKEINYKEDLINDEIENIVIEEVNPIAIAIVEGARKEVENRTRYRDAYYSGGYPPENEGVCTDLIWRALENAGYNLKDLMDKDIRENTNVYPRVQGSPDHNIDFRRVQNQKVFFTRFGDVITNEIIPGDIENLSKWKAGDIVTIHTPEHIGVISDKRNRNGVPYVIHNIGPVPREEDCLERWIGKITGHYRFPKESN